MPTATPDRSRSAEAIKERALAEAARDPERTAEARKRTGDRMDGAAFSERIDALARTIGMDAADLAALLSIGETPERDRLALLELSADIAAGRTDPTALSPEQTSLTERTSAGGDALLKALADVLEAGSPARPAATETLAAPGESPEAFEKRLREASMNQLESLSQARTGMATDAAAERRPLSLVLRRPLPLDAARAMSTQDLTRYVAQLSEVHNAFVAESAKTGGRLMDSSAMAEAYMTLLSGRTLDAEILREARETSRGMERARHGVRAFEGVLEEMLPTRVLTQGFSVENVVKDGVSVATLIAMTALMVGSGGTAAPVLAAAAEGASVARGVALGVRGVQIVRGALFVDVTAGVSGAVHGAERLLDDYRAGKPVNRMLVAMTVLGLLGAGAGAGAASRLAQAPVASIAVAANDNTVARQAARAAEAANDNAAPRLAATGTDGIALPAGPVPSPARAAGTSSAPESVSFARWEGGADAALSGSGTGRVAPVPDGGPPLPVSAPPSAPAPASVPTSGRPDPRIVEGGKSGTAGHGNASETVPARTSATPEYDPKILENQAKAAERSWISSEELAERARRWEGRDDLRIADNNRYLREAGLDEMTPDQAEVMLYVHRRLSKGLWHNDPGEIAAMRREMAQAGISDKQARTIMENGGTGELRLAKVPKPGEAPQPANLRAESPEPRVPANDAPPAGNPMAEAMRSLGSTEYREAFVKMMENTVRLGETNIARIFREGPIVADGRVFRSDTLRRIAIGAEEAPSYETFVRYVEAFGERGKRVVASAARLREASPEGLRQIIREAEGDFARALPDGLSIEAGRRMYDRNAIQAIASGRMEVPEATLRVLMEELEKRLGDIASSRVALDVLRIENPVLSELVRDLTEIAGRWDFSNIFRNAGPRLNIDGIPFTQERVLRVVRGEEILDEATMRKLIAACNEKTGATQKDRLIDMAATGVWRARLAEIRKMGTEAKDAAQKIKADLLPNEKVLSPKAEGAREKIDSTIRTLDRELDSATAVTGDRKISVFQSREFVNAGSREDKIRTYMDWSNEWTKPGSPMDVSIRYFEQIAENFSKNRNLLDTSDRNMLIHRLADIGTLLKKFERIAGNCEFPTPPTTLDRVKLMRQQIAAAAQKLAK